MLDRERNITDDAKKIIQEAVRAVLPDAAVERALRNHSVERPITLLAIGKAAWRMADAAWRTIGQENVRQGIVITKYGHVEGPIGCLELFEAGHPAGRARRCSFAARAGDGAQPDCGG